MQQFDLTKQPVLLTSLNTRVEKHGPDEHVPAFDLGIEFDTSNDVLVNFGPQLRQSLFEKSKSVGKQAELKGVDVKSNLPNLRNPEIDSTLKLNFEGVGYAMTLFEGLNDDVVVELTDCKVNSVRVDAHDGGTVTLKLRIQAAGADITKTTGKLHSLLGEERAISLDPPEADTKQEQIAA